MANQKKKEIRRVLMGLIDYEMDGAVIVAAEKLYNIQTHSLSTGADKVRFLGVHGSKRQYGISGDIEKTHEECIRAFAEIGRKVFLYSAPNALCTLRSPLWGPPILVSLEAEENCLNMELYTARGVLAGLRIRNTIKKVEELFPDSVKLIRGRYVSGAKEKQTKKKQAKHK